MMIMILSFYVVGMLLTDGHWKDHIALRGIIHVADSPTSGMSYVDDVVVRKLGTSCETRQRLDYTNIQQRRQKVQT